MNNTDQKSNTFHAVCRDCGTLKDETFDNKICKCGGTFHVDSARCLGCGKRHHFNSVNGKCSCGGNIVLKMVTCPSCKSNASLDYLGEFCKKCNVLLVISG